MKTIIVLLLLFISTFFWKSSKVFAQNRAIDSLLKVLNRVKEDTSKVKILNDLSKEFLQNEEYLSSRKYADEALALSIKIGFKKGKADALNLFGNIYDNQGNYSEALKEYFISLKIREVIGDRRGIAYSHYTIGLVYDNLCNYSEAIKEYLASLKIMLEIGDKKGIADLHNNIGTIYQEQGNYPEALKQYFISLKIREEIKDKKGIAASHNNIGIIYHDQGKYSEALKQYFASLKIKKEIGDKKGMATSLNNIGLIYQKQDKFNDALTEQYASLKISEEIGDKQGMATSHCNIGVIYDSQGKYSEALNEYLTSLKISEEIGDMISMAMAYENIGYAKLIMKKALEGRKWMEKALRLSLEIDLKEIIANGYLGLSMADSALGNFSRALDNYKMYITYKDSIDNEENTKKITQHEMQYEFDKKVAITKAEQEKKDALAQKELQKQKMVRNGFVGGFTIVLLFAIVFYMQRKRIGIEKKRSEALLLNILPLEVAEELKQKGIAEAKQFDDVTVIFTDFKDFTHIAEKLTPEELVTEIDICFKAFDNIMGKYNIEKIKTIGDSYMAAGGIPVPNKTNAVDAIKAALEIREFMQKYFQEKLASNKPAFEMRIGIHTGPVVAGIVGIKKFAYDIWGDTVNIASRMESSGEAGKINISGTTYELVKNIFNCEYRGKIEAKNKGIIDMYFVRNVVGS